MEVGDAVQHAFRRSLNQPGALARSPKILLLLALFAVVLRPRKQ